MQEVVYFQEKKMQEVTEFARRISVACVTKKVNNNIKRPCNLGSDLQDIASV